MTHSDRPCLICGNWKMYKTIDQALDFIGKIIPSANDVDCKVMLAVPFTALYPASEKAKGSKVLIGAQNINDAQEGAFTGEVAASMVKDAGGTFAIIGHSERRKIFGETNEFINRKVKKALSSLLMPIVCLGETFEDRQAGKTEEVLKSELLECLQGISKEQVENIALAYEPIWAIGTGIAASLSQVQDAHAFLRKEVKELWGAQAAKRIPILYGGSVKPDNAQDLLSLADVDGLLIGNASLDPESFAKIIALRHNVLPAEKTDH